jgi:ribonuclease VapC
VIAIDTSAVLAIVLREVDSPIFLAALLSADTCIMGAANLLEARMVLHGRDPANLPDLDAFMKQVPIRIEPVTEIQSDLAFAAFRRFGKGTGHPAGLNFGDCFAYALARAQACPLLFKGNDFGHTDIVSAI